MVRIKKSGVIEFCILALMLSAVSMAVFTKSGVSDGIPEAISIWVIGMGSFLILMVLKSNIPNSLHCGVLYMAYLVRVVCMLVDIYGREYITLLHSGGDSEGFFYGGLSLYTGTTAGGVVTKYPYVINAIFHITGANRICAQYVNIVFWVLSCLVLARLCRYFAVKESSRLWIYILWGFLPTGILLTGILLRESMEMFFGLWSFERFLYWMGCGEKRCLTEAFICVLPAIILHSASVALWAAYALVVMFWDTKRQRYRWQMKSMVVFVCAIVGMLLIFYSPLRFWLFTYLGNDFSIYAITHKYFESGGSDYLVNMDCRFRWQFAPYTALRMFYFLFSPLPSEARGIKDIAMFLADGLPLAVIIYHTFISACRRKEVRAYIYAALLGGFSFAGIFAWGVGNAGTALRHRYLAWSIFLVALCICYGHINENQKMRAGGKDYDYNPNTI